MTRGIVLLGHGSRDPGWRRPMDEVARRIRAASRQTPVACAFLELERPDLQAAVDELCAAGATSIAVLPLFLGMGKHAREDLPRLLEQARARHPGVEMSALTAAGEHPQVLDLLADLALRST